MNRRQVHDWVDAYARAWRSKDDAAVALLFTEDAVYKSHPFREPHVGREGVAHYWKTATDDQRELALSFGEPWWMETAFRSSGGPP